MRLMSTVCAVAVAAAAIAATPDAFAQRRGQAASVVVVNYQRVLAESSLGRDLQTKLNGVRTQVQGEAQALQPEAQSIEQEARRLQQTLRNQSQEQVAGNAQVQALAQRQNTLQQRNAGLVIDSSQALEVTGDYDITATVIQQLDQNAATRTANVSRRPVAECSQQAAPAAAQ